MTSLGPSLDHTGSFKRTYFIRNFLLDPPTNTGVFPISGMSFIGEWHYPLPTLDKHNFFFEGIPQLFICDFLFLDMLFVIYYSLSFICYHLLVILYLLLFCIVLYLFFSVFVFYLSRFGCCYSQTDFFRFCSIFWLCVMS